MAVDHMSLARAHLSPGSLSDHAPRRVVAIALAPLPISPRRLLRPVDHRRGGAASTERARRGVAWFAVVHPSFGWSLQTRPN